jgi:hypothetical protein
VSQRKQALALVTAARDYAENLAFLAYRQYCANSVERRFTGSQGFSEQVRV